MADAAAVVLIALLRRLALVDKQLDTESVGLFTFHTVVFADGVSSPIRLSRKGYVVEITHGAPSGVSVPSGEAILDELRRLLEQRDPAARRTTILLHSLDTDQVLDYIDKSDLGLLPVAIAELAELGSMASPQSAVVHLISQRSKPLDLSDYDPTSFANHRIYLGRRTEMNRVLRGATRSCAISGPRRIGKTSFARAVEREHKKGAEPVYFVNCLRARSVSAILKEIASDVQSGRELTSAIDHRDYDRVLRGLYNRHEQQIVHIILDEIDTALHDDRAEMYRLFAAIRGAQEAQQSRLIAVGWKDMMRSIVAVDNPLHGRLDVVQIRNLSVAESRDLVTRPMAKYAVHFENEDDIVHRIIDWTAGHPFYITLICQRLLQQVSRRDRVIQKRMLENVHDRELSRFMRMTLRANTSCLEELIASEAARAAVAESDLRDHVENRVGPIAQKTWEDCIEHLQVCDILEKRGHNVSIRVPLLRDDILRVDYEGQLQRLASDVGTFGKDSYGIRGTGAARQ